MTTVTVRPATRSDAPALSALLNAVIRAGGTTAFETEFTAQGFAERFLDRAGLVSFLVAEGPEGAAGFQYINRVADWPDDWATIATFARVGGTQRGVGSALMAETLARARAAGIAWIDATIRADNSGGLAFYTRQGFEDYRIAHAVPLGDGTPVDRISKRRAVGP